MDNQQTINLSGDGYAALQWARLASCKDATRPHLQSVAFSFVGDALVMVATDAYRMHVVKFRNGDAKDSGDLVDLPLPSDWTAVSESAIPKFAPATRKALDRGESLPLTVGSDFVTFGGVRVSKVDNQFPDASQLMPPVGDLGGLYGFLGAKQLGAAAFKSKSNLPVCIVDAGSDSKTLALAACGVDPIGVNAQFVADACSQKFLESDDAICINTISPFKPVLFGRTVSPNLTLQALVMPTRLP